MVEYSYPNNDSSNVININCVTGAKDHLYNRLKLSISKAMKIDIIVSFLMESGVKILEEDLKEAVDRGASLRILSGNYLNITQPQALYLLKGSLGDKVDLRFYNVPNKSFHPKAYIFKYEDSSEIFVGSSNISRSALTDGIEWNYRICSRTSPKDCSYFMQNFEDLFLNQSIVVDDNEMRRYSKSWKKPKLLEDLERFENEGNSDKRPVISGKNLITTIEQLKVAENNPAYHVDNQDVNECKIIAYPRPIGPQIEALYELKKTRLDGWDKGIIVAATGVGKTFLAAFDSQNFHKVLFVAHREEILLQAERTYKCVQPDISIGYFNGVKKDTNCSVLLATVQTIGRPEYLKGEVFEKDEFDYIVIDEFHHAVAGNYTNIIEYFCPKFMLGLTATPERLDNQDVFALCDYNVVYEARLKEAINKGWLVPFRYYGVYDETDYSRIDYANGRYDDKQLEQALNINKRANLILENYLNYNSERALGFCSSRNHAVFMAKYFVDNGVSACAVISGNIPENKYNLNDNNAIYKILSTYVIDRKEAICKFKKGQIKIVFSVDMFNEGLDVPETDMVMFLRPTQSPTIFLQQLGRGLRKSGKKSFVNVLDFIGNYKKVNLIPFFLTGDAKYLTKKSKEVYVPDEEDYPDGCFVNFDFRIINIFKKMEEEQRGIFEKVEDEYLRIKNKLKIKPLRLSMYTYLEEDIYKTIRTKRDLNIFKDYLSFLDKIGELSNDEKNLIGTKAHEFLKEIENTGMTKTYKMPPLLSFYKEGVLKLIADEEDIYRSFKAFYSHGSNAIDMLKDKSTKNYKEWGKKEYVSLARRNPINFLSKSTSEFFYVKDNCFCITPELEKFIDNPAFTMHFKDIIAYKTRKFYKDRLEKLHGLY